MKRKRNPFWMTACCLLAVWLESCSAQGAMKSSDPGVPVAQVKEASVQLQVNTTGELRSTKTAMLVAPPIAGGTLQIIHLVKAGTQVKAGDPVVEFDPSQQEYNLSQSQSDYEQAEQEIVKAKDDAAVQAAQDQTALLKAQFDVRQAELEVSKNELVSAIDAQKNELTLDEAKRALAQLQQDIQSHAASGQATVALDEEKAHKAKLAMEQAQENIKNMRVTSPINGRVVIRQNENASGGFFFSGMTLPEFQEGDQVYPGGTIADVVDMSQMEIAGRVSESDRVNVKTGQPVEIHVDVLPGDVFHGKVKTVGGSGGGFFFDDNSGRKSEVTVQLEDADSRLRPGFTAHLRILGDHLEKALTIPREAVFERDGKAIVYAKTGNGFEPRPIQIQFLSQGMAVISGLAVGSEVALINPEQVSAGSAKPATTGPTVGPGKP